MIVQRRTHVMEKQADKNVGDDIAAGVRVLSG